MTLHARAAEPCTTAAERAAGLSTVSTMDAADIDYAPRMTESQRALLAAGGAIEVGHTTYDVPPFPLMVLYGVPVCVAAIGVGCFVAAWVWG